MARKDKGTKDLFLQKALELFAERGYKAVSVAQIAAEVGCTAPALYKHYQSKKDLFDSLEGVSGKFTVEFSKFNEFGRDFIRNLGGTMLYEDDERFATEMTIEQGKIIFNGHVF